MAPVARRRTFVVGVGCTAFEKPRGRVDYPYMAIEAATKALLDAGINYDDVEQAYVGHVFGDSTSGQRALYGLGLTQIPIVNVNNNCSTGSSALYLARQFVELGAIECAMALGFDKMAPGSLGTIFSDRAPPLEKTIAMTAELGGFGNGPFAAQIFGNGGEEYCQRYGATWEDISAIAAKNHQHSVNNPYAQFRNPMTTEEVLKDKIVTGKMTRGCCCPTSDGAACAIVCSEDFVKKHNLQNQAIEIVGQSMTTDSPKLFNERSAIELTGADMSRKAAQEAYKQAGVGPADINVIELHDCFAANELLVYEALGLSEPGKAHELVRSGNNTYGGKYVINPSGGLESKGHPLGATGLGMVFYLTMQLRGWAGPMQMKEVVPGYQEERGKQAYALAHNLGLGGSCVVSILKRPDFYKPGGQDGRARVGYNHAHECKPVSQKDIDKVKSRKANSQFAEEEAFLEA